MTGIITLRGLTWDHPRAYEGLAAETDRFNALQDRIRLEWDRHSLAGFEATPIGETAARYDLLILDHPFMGDAVASGCLVDLADRPELVELARPHDFIGPSLESYRLGGGLWAMPIDAACQVAAWRPDLIEQPPTTLDALREWVRGRPIVLAMARPHAFMNFLCIAGMQGSDISGAEDALLPRAVALQALDLLRELAAAIPAAAYGWSSIGALNALAASPDLAFCPMVFGFNTYARDARAGAVLRFCTPPLAHAAATSGAIAGGTGLAISAASSHRGAAVEAVAFLSGPESQIRCALAGGQPARIEAWTDAATDSRNGRFFSDCRAAMAGARLRPRYAGYIALQNAAGDLIATAARDRSLPAHVIIDRIDEMHRDLRSSSRGYSL